MSCKNITLKMLLQIRCNLQQKVVTFRIPKMSLIVKTLISQFFLQGLWSTEIVRKYSREIRFLFSQSFFLKKPTISE